MTEDPFHGRSRVTKAVPFYAAVGFAVLAHAVLFLAFSPASEGMTPVRKIDLVFWGSILRAQDLMPYLSSEEESPDVRVIAPVAFIRSTELGAWKFGSSVEKPEHPTAQASFFSDVVPEKFSTERVVLDDVADVGTGFDLPQAAAVSLKVPRP